MRFSKVVEFIREHGVTPSPRDRFYGINDTILGWLITAFTFTFFSISLDPITAELSFIVLFFSGSFILFLYVLFESICSGNKLSGLKELLIKDYTETATHDIHLNTRQRKKFIYTRGIISAGSFITLTLAKDLFGVIDNSAIFGADALVYAILSAFIFLQIFTLREWLGIAIGAIGVFFILFFDITSFSWKTGVFSGFVGILSALFFSIIFFITSIIVRHDTPIRVAFHQCFIGTILATLCLAFTFIIKSFSQEEWTIPNISSEVIKSAIVMGVLYGTSLVFFLRAFVYTEPIIIAMLGYSMSIFTFIFEWFFKDKLSSYKDIIGSGLITIGCSLIIYEEYLKNLLLSKKMKNLKPIYHKSLRHDLLALEEKFHAGEINKYEYLNDKHEFNKILLEYSVLISNSIIERIEISQSNLLFSFKPLNIQLKTDGGARSAPFEILNFGNYEPEDESMTYSLIQNGETILDIGAHIGWYTVNLAKRFPLSKVYSFEPIEFTFNVLKENVEINKLPNVAIFNYGLSSKEKEGFLYYFKSGSAVASLENLLNHSNAQKVKCHFKVLDNEIQRLMLKSVDFLKCDVEGSELFVLQGAETMLKQFKPIILLELFEEWCNKCGYKSEDLVNFLKSINYEIFQAKNGKLIKIVSTVLDNELNYNYFFLDRMKHKDLIEKYSPN